MKTMTDDTLRDVRRGLLVRCNHLRERVGRVQADLRRDHAPLPLDAPDAASARENDDVLQAVERAALAEISSIETALARMEAGMFGLCDACGEEIEAARLVAVPYATRCKTCARED